MKIITGIFSKKKWVVNTKGVRVTPKCGDIKIAEYGPYSVIEMYDDYSKRKIRPSSAGLFSSKTARRIISYDIKAHRQIFDNVVALYFHHAWHFFTLKGAYLRGGIKEFIRCSNYPYIIANIENRYYFLDETMSIVSDGYAYASNFDKYGYSEVIGYLSGKRYLINSNMEIVCGPIECDEIKAVSEDRFAVKIAGLYGLVDNTNKEILSAEYDEIIMFGSSHFKIKKTDKYGLVDNTGKSILECYYDNIVMETDKSTAKAYVWYEKNVKLEIPKE